MSLLMDALNKAEQAKRQSQANTDVNAGTATTATTPPAALKLELTPMMGNDSAPPPPATQAPSALPQLPEHLGVLDEEFIAHAATTKQTAKEKKPARPAPAESATPPAPAAAAAPSTQKADATDRQAAQNVFDAKQPPRPPFINKRIAALGLLAVVAASAIGVYFWLQLQPGSGLNLAKPMVATPPRPPIQPAQTAPPPAQAAPQAPLQQASEPAPPAAAAVTPPAREEPTSPIRISTAKLTLNPSLANAYDAYIASNFELAKSEYLQVLKSEPNNLDALHGMAAISLRQGQNAAAEEFYRQALEADPKDALAQAGLIGLKGQMDPFQAETRLKALLAAQPELPSINFALGSLYASQNRWNEAQAAFFKAYKGEPDNPDTLFNLAVSLDQLHQPKLALQFYNQALAVAANRPASFDKAQVGIRLHELQP